MQIYLATKTLQAIEQAISADQGASFRGFLGEAIKDVGDAYDTKPPGFRSHFGVSTSGEECARKLWYNWRWLALPTFSGRMMRLFNRGHLEEARFVAMLRSIGVQLYQADEQGKQYRVSLLGGHYGSAIDGVAVGIPDLPTPETPCLAEFKTHNEKSFKKLQSQGLLKSKPKHYAQMIQYMEYYNLDYGLYLAVNKNDDDLYAEIILRDPAMAAHYADRSAKIIFATSPPPRYGSPDTFECRYCDHKMYCHYGEGVPVKSCRTCRYGEPQPDGTWVCMQTGEVLDKAAQEAACPAYELRPMQ